MSLTARIVKWNSPERSRDDRPKKPDSPTQHGQPCVDALESGPVGGGREARSAGDGDEQDDDDDDDDVFYARDQPPEGHGACESLPSYSSSQIVRGVVQEG